MPDADHSRWVSPEQIAGVVRFLCEDGAGHRERRARSGLRPGVSRAGARPAVDRSGGRDGYIERMPPRRLAPLAAVAAWLAGAAPAGAHAPLPGERIVAGVSAAGTGPLRA